MSLTRTTFAQMANSTRPAPRWLMAAAVTTLIVAGGLTSRPEAQVATAALHGVGQLSGALRTGTVIRDATRVWGVIYAVGGAAARVCGPGTFLCGETDTAVLWRRGGAWPAGALEALPNNFNNTTVTTPHTAYAITPDATYIGSQTRIGADNARRAARVTTSLLPSPLANLIVGTTLSPPPLAVGAMSNDGTVLYGTSNEGTFNPPNFPHRGVRMDASTNSSLFIPFVAPSDTWNPVAEKGSSADGTVAVGSSFLDATNNHKAYRYVHGAGVTAIPFLPGGTFNDGVAVSSDGNLVLVTGNSTANPNGEAYFYTASTGAIEPLGSPNTRWRPGCGQATACITSVPGGMTADGSVVVMAFNGAGDWYSYFRNDYGWFHLTSALAAHGVDLAAEGWDGEGARLRIHGISADGTLVSGAGMRNGILEGFVAEFAPGALAAFNPQAAPPVSTSLVGVWTFDPNFSDPSAVVVFTADGVYYEIEEGQGFERGLYTYDGINVTFTTLLDTNGSAGLSGSNGLTFPVGAPIGDELQDENGVAFGWRFPGAPGTIAGGWVAGDPTEAHNAIVVVLTDNKIFNVFDFPDGYDSDVGTYTWNPETGELVDDYGGGPEGGNSVTLSADGLRAHVVGDDGEEFDITRVIDPAAIPAITSPLSASGTVGQAFSYDVVATNTATFGATGLPGGLAINSGTGAITGTPTVGGQFAVVVTATDATVGVSDIETLTLTIAIPTPIGQNVVVEPVVPEGQGPVTMTFGEVTTAGTTTVTVVDQSEVPAPGTVAIGGVVYEVTTTATYTGLIQLCFSYAGIDFGAATPRLFHYENGVWVDITTSVDAGTQTICGATTTLSPFAVLVSNVVRSGFYAPVNPVAGFLNSVKGGATVPLKFDVFVNGVEQTSTLGLAMSQTLLASCDANAPEDPVEPAPTTGGATLRYDATAGHFIQNWKAPKTPGCYMVRMTTAQDGLALTARFIVR